MASDPSIKIDEKAASRLRWLRDLYARHHDGLCRHLRQTFGNGPPDPEDVAHGVFAKLALLEKPEAIDNPKAFIYAAARNSIVDHHRKKARQSGYARDQQLTGEKSWELSPERVLLGREALERVEAAIRAMPAKDRDCLLLHRVHGLGFTAIAQQLGLSDTGVAKIVRRAMEACRKAAMDGEK